MAGLWNKFLVMRRDGSVPEWPYFVIGARDPAAPAALTAYAHEAQRLGMDPEYAKDLVRLADEFDRWREAAGEGDPDAPPHRVDDPEIIARWRTGTVGHRGGEPGEVR